MSVYWDHREAAWLPAPAAEHERAEDERAEHERAEDMAVPKPRTAVESEQEADVRSG